MGTDPVVDSRTGKVVGVCWSKECSAGCGRDVLDLKETEHLCRECDACPNCCSCAKKEETDDG